MKCLLDTCAFLWMSQAPRELSPAASSAINDPDTQLFVSVVSIWEIVMKHSAGKLPLPGPPRSWVAEKLEYHKVAVLELNPSAIFTSGELPRVHNDPFDRLLAAQAMEAGMTILSPDVPISLLGASRVW